MSSINFKQLAMADLDINSNIEPISKVVEQALSNFLKNREKKKTPFIVEANAVKKQDLVKYLSKQLLDEVDKVVKEKGITEADFKRLEIEHFRTKNKNISI